MFDELPCVTECVWLPLCQCPIRGNRGMASITSWACLSMSSSRTMSAKRWLNNSSGLRHQTFKYSSLLCLLRRVSCENRACLVLTGAFGCCLFVIGIAAGCTAAFVEAKDCSAAHRACQRRKSLFRNMKRMSSIRLKLLCASKNGQEFAIAVSGSRCWVKDGF
ncbi:hypothetical protein VTI28DRAFT_3705 [Corynascus sepedonium]